MFCLLLGLFFFACNSNDSRVNIPAGIGETAPGFALKDMSGNTVTLSAYKDRVILLEFWATWCPPCKASIPELIELQKRYTKKGFTVIAVSMDTVQDVDMDLTEFARLYHINYPVLRGNGTIARLYNISGLPVSFLIDKRGKIVHSYVGFIDNLKDEISAQIEKII
jgi:peroxiredoxin